MAQRSAAEIRERIDHPVIDSDGHDIEYLPLVRDFMRELGGDSVVSAFDSVTGSAKLARSLSADQMRALGMMRIPWWGLPARNTLDRATAMLPSLLYERLDELGLDFAVLYPTYGLTAMSLDGDELRQAACRAFNRYHAEAYREYADRLTPVAVIPMHTPEEAIAELDYAVNELGLKSALVTGHVLRPLPGDNEARAARWLDTFGFESAHDYDPVWQKCSELGISPTFHSSGMGWGSRASTSNYVFNHIGNFANAGEAICRSLFLSGVPHRFPSLRFAFLEGGVGWACNLYADLLGHWEKRNAAHIHHYDPAQIDRARLEELFKRYAQPAVLERLDRLDESLTMLSEPDEDRTQLDEFAASGVESADDIRQLFSERFHFGCEADDPMNAAAFDSRRNPLAARLKALFSSDIGHWDVPDMRGVLSEAWELVEHQHIDESDFRAFVFDNPVSLWTGGNPRFFEGTAVEAAVAARG